MYRKWYIDEVFVRNGVMYDRGYYIVQDNEGHHIEWVQPIPNGRTVVFSLEGSCHQNGAPIMPEDGDLLGELAEVSVERIEIREDFPKRDEAYAILTDGERFAFAWGPKFPYDDVVPAQDVNNGESGIDWYDNEDDARAAMQKAEKVWGDIQGN